MSKTHKRRGGVPPLNGRLWNAAEDDPVRTLEAATRHQGSNLLVFKMVNHTEHGSGCVRFVDRNGLPARGIRVGLTPNPD
jgi:hypothetical protein